MATTETMTTPNPPDIAALGQSLTGLSALGGDKARGKIAALDSAWEQANGSVVATAHSLGQSYGKTLNDLARAPIKRIAVDDPRIFAYQIGTADISAGLSADTSADTATRAAQERAAMQRLSRNSDDERGMDALLAISRAEAQRDMTRTIQAKKTKTADAR